MATVSEEENRHGTQELLFIDLCIQSKGTTKDPMFFSDAFQTLFSKGLKWVVCQREGRCTIVTLTFCKKRLIPQAATPTHPGDTLRSEHRHRPPHRRRQMWLLRNCRGRRQFRSTYAWSTERIFRQILFVRLTIWISCSANAAQCLSGMPCPMRCIDTAKF
jgi:hypothetical protein